MEFASRSSFLGGPAQWWIINLLWQAVHFYFSVRSNDLEWRAWKWVTKGTGSAIIRNLCSKLKMNLILFYVIDWSKCNHMTKWSKDLNWCQIRIYHPVILNIIISLILLVHFSFIWFDFCIFQNMCKYKWIDKTIQVRPTKKKKPINRVNFSENCNDLSEKAYIFTKFSLSSFFWHQLQDVLAMQWTSTDHFKNWFAQNGNLRALTGSATFQNKGNVLKDIHWYFFCLFLSCFFCLDSLFWHGLASLNLVILLNTIILRK